MQGFGLDGTYHRDETVGLGMIDQEHDSNTRKQRRRAIEIQMLLSEKDDAERGIDPRLRSPPEI